MLYSGISNKEMELVSFIKSVLDIYKIEVITNVKIIPPYEIDIYIPQLQIGIEFNGDYWHSIYKKDYLYHYNKWYLCYKKDIQLIQIFEHEWDNNKEVVKYILKREMGLSTHVSFKDCIVKDSIITFDNNVIGNIENISGNIILNESPMIKITGDLRSIYNDNNIYYPNSLGFLPKDRYRLIKQIEPELKEYNNNYYYDCGSSIYKLIL